VFGTLQAGQLSAAASASGHHRHLTPPRQSSTATTAVDHETQRAAAACQNVGPWLECPERHGYELNIFVMFSPCRSRNTSPARTFREQRHIHHVQPLSLAPADSPGRRLHDLRSPLIVLESRSLPLPDTTHQSASKYITGAYQ
jgi:hypothetical protein